MIYQELLSFIIQKFSTLPEFTPFYKEKIVFIYSDNKFYIGTDSGWEPIIGDLPSDSIYSFSFTCPEDPEGNAIGIKLQISDYKNFSNMIIDVSTYNNETNWYLFDSENWISLENIPGTGIIPSGYQGSRIEYEFSNDEIKRGKIYYCRFQVSDDSETWSSWIGETKVW